jgi:hypothetical protein
MFQVDDLAAARSRAGAAGVREVFAVEVDDISEVHLHPADMRGAIVSLSQPRPPGSWRWGGPEWERHTVPLRVAGVTVGVTDPQVVSRRWTEVVGAAPGVRFVSAPDEPGLIEIEIGGSEPARPALELGAVRLTFVETR